MNYEHVPRCHDTALANIKPGKWNIRILVRDAGFQLRDFRIDSRTVTGEDGMLVWVRLASVMMVKRDEIGQPHRGRTHRRIPAWERDWQALRVFAVRYADRDQTGLIRAGH